MQKLLELGPIELLPHCKNPTRWELVLDTLSPHDRAWTLDDQTLLSPAQAKLDNRQLPPRLLQPIPRKLLINPSDNGPFSFFTAPKKEELEPG